MIRAAAAFAAVAFVRCFCCSLPFLLFPRGGGGGGLLKQGGGERWRERMGWLAAGRGLRPPEAALRGWGWDRCAKRELFGADDDDEEEEGVGEGGEAAA